MNWQNKIKYRIQNITGTVIEESDLEKSIFTAVKLQAGLEPKTNTSQSGATTVRFMKKHPFT